MGYPGDTSFTCCLSSQQVNWRRKSCWNSTRLKVKKNCIPTATDRGGLRWRYTAIHFSFRSVIKRKQLERQFFFFAHAGSGWFSAHCSSHSFWILVWPDSPSAAAGVQHSILTEGTTSGFLKKFSSDFGIQRCVGKVYFCWRHIQRKYNCWWLLSITKPSYKNQGKVSVRLGCPVSARTKVIIFLFQAVWLNAERPFWVTLSLSCRRRHPPPTQPRVFTSIVVLFLGIARVPVWVKKGTISFPVDDSVPVVMVGPGTGVAPFRSFIQHRTSSQKSGNGTHFIP